jgi:hypothetical protein
MAIHQYDEKTSDQIKKELNLFLGIEEEEKRVFFEILKRTGSLIAGGSILHYLIKKGKGGNVKDLDIYTNTKGAKELVSFFSKHYNIKKSAQNITPAYDESFLRANHIHSRIFLALGGTRMNSFQASVCLSDWGRPCYKNKNGKCVDIMIVDDAFDVHSVVTNFDLTFCQVFFDGVNVYATHPEHVETKVGYLNPDYLKSYLNCNRFILDRMEKYKSKGFTIKINTKTEYCEKTIDIKNMPKKTSSMEEWIVKKIYTILLDNTQRVLNLPSLSIPPIFVYLDLFIIKQYTIEALFSLIKKLFESKCLSGKYYYQHRP